MKGKENTEKNKEREKRRLETLDTLVPHMAPDLLGDPKEPMKEEMLMIFWGAVS